MARKLAILLVLAVFTISLGGCATARKKQEQQIQGLKDQVCLLETQLQAKDEEIGSLRDALARAEETRDKGRLVIEAKSRPTVKHIQMALSNAGYNPGPADAKMGKQTRDAIKAFQSANNLTADGKVGKQTWTLLSKYLYQKAK